MSSTLRHITQAWFCLAIAIPVTLIFFQNEDFGILVSYMQILIYAFTYLIYVIINQYKLLIIENKVFISILILVGYSAFTHGIVPAILMLFSFLFSVALFSLPIKVTRLVSIFLVVLVFSSVVIYLMQFGIFASSGPKRNLLSVFLVSTQIFFTISEFRATKKVTILLPLFTVILCSLSYGRTGIITSLLLLSVVVYYKYKKPFLLLVLPLLLLLAFINLDFFANFFQNKTNFASGFVSARWDAWDEYLNTMTLHGFIYGVDLYNLEFATLGAKYNPESSFILGHSRYGITYIIFWLAIILSIYKSVLKASINNYIYLMLFLVLLARAFADSIALPGPFDFIYFYVFFVVIKQSSLNEMHSPLPKS